ncbi:MAG: transposase [Chloroflexota bacterium]|nr:transposase [Chloroflexota bacterium]
MVDATLDPGALIRKHLENADPDLLRELLQEVVEALMSAEVDGLAGAAYGSRDPARTNRRNGYRGRRWDTRVGTIGLRIPKLRQGSYNMSKAREHEMPIAIILGSAARVAAPLTSGWGTLVALFPAVRFRKGPNWRGLPFPGACTRRGLPRLSERLPTRPRRVP